MSVEEGPLGPRYGTVSSGFSPRVRPSGAAGKKKPRHKAGAISMITLALVASCPKLSSSVRCNQASVRRSNQPLFYLFELHAFDIPRQSELLQRPDAVPVGVDLVPGKPVGSRRRMRVVIVM